MTDTGADPNSAERPVYEGSQPCEHCGQPIDRAPQRGQVPHFCSRCASPEGRAARHAAKAADQLGIPLWPLARHGRSIGERYAAWRATEHGREVYRLFKKFAGEALASGRRRYSHKDVVSRIRWHVDVETQSPDSFKINDHYTGRMARELIEEDERFDGFFEVRKIRSP